MENNTDIGQVVILAGGRGTRISEETSVRPKPLVEIGGIPIIWHIINFYRRAGKSRFLVLTGYKGEQIKHFFLLSKYLESDVEINFANGSVKNLGNTHPADIQVSVVDTGLETMTGGRLKRASEYLDDEFHLTYGDGLSSVNLFDLEALHKAQENLVTLTAVQPAGRFGSLSLDFKNSTVTDFKEKPTGDSTFVNGGFMVMKKEILNYLPDDTTVLEKDPLETIAKDGNLGFYAHRGFWQPMDTLRDKQILEDLWYKGAHEW